jgi:hypothetical protein
VFRPGSDPFNRLTRPDDIDPDADIWPTAWTDTLFEAFRPAQL